MTTDPKPSEPRQEASARRRKLCTRWIVPARVRDGYIIAWVTDEDIVLHDGRYNTRAQARAAARRKMDETGYDCRVFRSVWEYTP